jgi:hypothetical protein
MPRGGQKFFFKRAFFLLEARELARYAGTRKGEGEDGRGDCE